MKALPSTIPSKVFGPDGLLSSSQSISSLTQELQRFFAKEKWQACLIIWPQVVAASSQPHHDIKHGSSTRDLSEGVVGPQAAVSASVVKVMM